MFVPDYRPEYIFSYTAQVRLPPEVIGPTPDGIRANFYVIGGEVEGPKLKGKIAPVGADWLLIRRDGIAILDVRATKTPIRFRRVGPPRRGGRGMSGTARAIL